MMDVIEDVNLLHSRFLAATEVDYHLDPEGRVKQCCQTARLTMESSLIASSSKSGLSGVLDFLQSKLRWGMIQEKYYCDCLKTDYLACGASTAIACWALEYYRDNDTLHGHSDHDYAVISVQLIQRGSKENAALWRSEIEKRKSDNTLWICDSCNFHECVGLINKTTRELSVWDFGLRKKPHTNAASAGALLSIRLDSRCKHKADRIGDYNALMGSKVIWEGFEIELEKWTDLPSFESASSLTIKAQSYLLGDVYSLDQTVNGSNVKAGSSPVVYISGVEMGSNPCAGVGVARAIRSQFPRAVIVAVDDAGGSAAGGMCDPVFDRTVQLAVMGGSCLFMNGSAEEKFRAAVEILSADRSAYFLPCRDQDVIAMARGKAALIKKMKERNSIDKTEKTDEAALRACDRILSPAQVAVDFSDKPNILDASDSKLKSFFKIPEYLKLDPDSTSWVEVQAFAERIGYPVVIKGSTMGCALCHRWTSLAYYLTAHFSEGGFVQKHVYGSDITVAFAACRGDLTGCIRMIKESYTDAGKVWDGGISPVPGDLTDAIDEFVRDTTWTGGGELEMIEDLSGNLWLIDFNVRFPAWIFASSFSGCNLPGNLIEHVMLYESSQIAVPTWDLSDFPTKNVPYLHRPGKRLALQTARASFTRSTVEIPRANITIERTMRLPACPLSNHLPQNKGGRATIKVKNGSAIPIIPALPCKATEAPKAPKAPEAPEAPEALEALEHLNDATANLTLTPSEGWVTDTEEVDESKTSDTPTSCAVAMMVTSMHRDLTALGAAAVDLLNRGPTFTPQRILCMESVRESLERHQRIFSTAASEAYEAVTELDASTPSLTMQLCLSVKTQPHQAVLTAARDAQYVAECISLAEVHAALAAGFPSERIVLTGPGKFHDISGTDTPRAVPGPLRAIFADSISDLKIILRRVLDPCDWLDCHILGVRWIPSWQVVSRFGLDPKDPQVVKQASELLTQLPASKGLGMHFHFASSTIGADTWFGLARAFCHFSAGFSKLINRPIEAIDFGGGWSPHFYLEDSGSTNSKLRSLLETVYHDFSAATAVGPLPSVQFEPGKCITEAAGGILTRILDIREIIEPPKNREDESYSIAPRVASANGATSVSTTGTENDDNSEHTTVKKGREKETPRAVIVDTCIAEVSSPHIHPIFWRSKSHPSGLGRPGDSTGWIALKPGDNVIWGRTCMEFDLINGTYELPPGAQPGDYLLIAASGSYDFTNSYDFGDGVARQMTLL